MRKRKEKPILMMTDAKINAGINANERIDDLCRDNLRLIQNTDVFCFGMDAVLLSTFAKAGKNQKVLDMVLEMV